MTCPWCNATNREGAAFCRNCGRLLLSACPTCGAAATAGANFCDTCGRPHSPQAWLAAATPSLPRPLPNPLPQGEGVTPPVTHPSPPSDPADTLQQFIPRELQDKLRAARRAGTMAGERRVVTMLFCDIKGSTALAEQLDPEEWSDIVNGAFERMVRPVYRYEGTVARLMGDGLLAFFGAPIAHEDDPRRAVLAALEIVAGMAEFRAHLPPRARELDVRVGINTGLVVVGAVGSDLRLEYSALGDAINVAARMEQTALPGTIQITEDTLRAVAGQFEVEPLGGIEVKGKAAPVSAYRVLRRRTGIEARRFQQMRLHAPLVNRLREWELLRGVFDGLGNGRGNIVFLSGDAGLGKTRLMDEALERLAPPLGAQVATASAYAYELNQPYGLSVRLLRGVLGIMAGDSPEAIRARIDDALVGEGGEQRRVLQTLLGVSPDPPGHELSGEAFASQLIACVDAFWRARAAAGPVVLALDDLQWADASSVALLTHLFGLSESAPLLFLCAMRRDRRSHGWRLRDAAEHDFPHRFDEAALYPLTDGESRLLLDGLLDGSSLPAGFDNTILARAEGNPLFLEEVVHNLIERGQLVREAEGAPWTAAAALTGVELPDSLQALLTARIDRLEEDTRRTLQIASIIGRTFLRSALAALVERPDALDRQLLELQRTELVREVTRLPEPEYAFHHTLIHEATYNTILVKERRALHRRMAEILSARPDATATALAHHWLEGDTPARALPHLLAAGDTALKLNATAEAVAHYERARPIALAENDTAGLVHLTTARGRALELESRFADADSVYSELERLGDERDEPRLQLAALIAQGKLRANVTPFYDPVAGRALMQRALALAEQLDDRPAEVRILWNLLNIDRFDVFNLENATQFGERALNLARELGLAEETAYLLNDLGEALGSLGHMEEAREMMGEAVQHWRELGNEPMLADGLTGLANWTAFGGDLPGGRAAADEAYAVNVRIGNPWGQAYSGAVRGLIRSLQGEIGAGVEGLQTAIEKAQEAGFVGGQVLARAFLSQILLGVGAIDEATVAAEEGLAVGRAQLPQFAGMCLARLALAQIAADDVAAAAALLDDPLLEGTRQQAFVEIDVTLARIALALAGGEPAAALAQADTAAQRLEETNGVIWLPEVLRARAQALAALGRPTEAIAALASAASVARAAGARGLLWSHLIELAGAQARLGDNAAAVTRREADAELEYVRQNTWPDALCAALQRANETH
ncbi:MAG: AAA family ATPase [Candidatus Promineofilum sp.]|nr:AAA family ATPase [Promineifilum sp.]